MARDCDVVIFGGGVAGLWCRFALEAAGYSTLLLERCSLGAGQTLASQGILHRGVKYALLPAARAAAAELARAHGAWSTALAGGGQGMPDLSRVRTLADEMHLWSPPGLAGALTGAAAAKVMNSEVESLERGRWPASFAGAPAGTRVWRVDERVLDAKSLVEALDAAGHGPMWRAADTTLTVSDDGGVAVEIALPGGTQRVTATAAVCAAGEGNETLLSQARIEPRAVCQRRPLHMVMVRPAPFELFAHCPQPASDKPLLTVTTGTRGTERVWYLGGELAERGVDLDACGQRDATRAALARCMPWVDAGAMKIATFKIDRAEGRTPEGKRPDGAVVRRWGPIVAAWPTKLALTPALAAEVVTQVQQAVPGGGTGRATLPFSGGAVEAGVPPWDWEGLEWK